MANPSPEPYTSPVIERLSRAASGRLADSMSKAIEAIRVMAELDEEQGRTEGTEAAERVAACMAIAMLQFYRAFPDGVIGGERARLRKEEEEMLALRKGGGKPYIQLALEAVQIAQDVSESIEQTKKHGRKR